MKMPNILLRSCLIGLISVGLSHVSAVAQSSSTQYEPAPASMSAQFEVTNEVESIKLIAGSSQRLKFGYMIPELLVENPEVISANAVSQNEITITGLKPGISSVTVSDPDKKLQTITVEVTIDVRKLTRALAANFKDSKIEVVPLNTSVILNGYVARADQLQNILAVARDYFPDTEIVNGLQINGSQNIAIKVKVYEVSRTKLRQLGVDWSFFGDTVNAVSSVSDLILAAAADGVQTQNTNLSFGVLNNGTQFNLFLEALERNNVAKLMDQPILVAQNGRPAEFLSGGEFPIEINQGLGNTTIEFKPFGTKLDIVPFVHGQGLMTLQVRAEVSEIANDLASDLGIPGFRVRRVNTGVKMKAGHTLALAGDYRERTDAEVRGIPRLLDNPVFGPLFRRVEESTNETELLFMITPRFISEVEPNSIPDLSTGQLTVSPSDRELYRNGYIEAPRCEQGCPVNDRFDRSSGNSVQAYPQHQVIEAAPQVGHGQPSYPIQQPQQFIVPQQPQQFIVPQQPQSGLPALSNVSPWSRNRPVPSGAVARQADARGGFSWPSRR